MGNDSSSTSSIRNENNQLVVNKSDINIMSKDETNLISNQLMERASNCASKVAQNQNMTFSGLTAAGGISLGGLSQKQSAVVNFSCIDASSVRSEIAQEMMSKMMSQIEGTTNADILTKMDAVAKSKLEEPAYKLSVGSSSSSASNVENINNYKSVTDTHKNLETVLKKNVENNFHTKNVSDCINSVTNNQNITAQGLTAKSGNIDIQNLSQDQTAEALTSCISQQDVSNKILSGAMSDLGVKVAETSTTKTSTDQKGTAESVMKTKGIAEEIGDMFASIIGSSAGLSIAGSVLFCCLSLIAVLFMYFFGTSKETAGLREAAAKRISRGGNLETDISPLLIGWFIILLVIMIVRYFRTPTSLRTYKEHAFFNNYMAYV